MPIPDYQSLMLPLLRLVGDRQKHPLAEVRQRIAEELKLTEEDLALQQASGSQTLFANRIAWAVQYLKSALLIRAVTRGVYEVTERGISILDENPPEITLRMLRVSAK